MRSNHLIYSQVVKRKSVVCPPLNGLSPIKKIQVPMNRSIITLLILLSSSTYAEMSFMEEVLIGRYILIGKAVDSDETYLGRVEIAADDDRLVVVREIDGRKVRGSAVVESALNGDAEVLRIRFFERGKQFEESCLFRGDLDNYSRISCYLYQPAVPTSNPGLEAMFHDQVAE